ncbi:desmoplakin [Trichoplusia ni granulovirus LBIV-12]|uniref:Desmoplakin n=1 Tax=Trichoplusia ni granulovirus LBIV-12 TaxID=1916701 RepID=A0A1D8QLF5_GVTN|nr:desmoplakin [Trichoplusia ni granulovirus LBIV-12]AOW41467.1 desmoplakin [Trichoplusia ni granulovirus LBIV-12]
MLTRYKGVDVNPHTVHNLIRTIVTKQSNTNDNDHALRSIIFSFRPDLSNSSLSTVNLLIRVLKDCNKKEVTYNYRYETNNHDEQHIAATTAPPSDIFIKMWRLHNVDREEACVLAAAVRDLCYAVLKHYDPKFDPDQDNSAASLLKLCTEVRYTKQYAYEESQAMNREVQDLEKDLLESRAKVAELLASFSNCKSEWEKKCHVAWENNQKSENEVARLQLLLLERDELVNSLQIKLAQLNDALESLEENNKLVGRDQMQRAKHIEDLTSTIKEQASRIHYLEQQSRDADQSNDTRLILLEKEYSERVRVLEQKHTMKLEEVTTELSLVKQHYVQQSTLAEELQQRLHKAEGQNKLLQAQSIDTHMNNSMAQTNLDNMQARLNNIMKENEILKKQIDTLQTINSQDVESNAELQSVNKKLKTDNDNVRLQLDVETKKYDDLQKELEKALRENDENADTADRSYNLQKGELNRLEMELDSTVDKLKQVTEELRQAKTKIDEHEKTIEYCNYEIRALSSNKNPVTDNRPKISPQSKKKLETDKKTVFPETSKKSKLPIKHKLDTTNNTESLIQKIAKKTLTWDVNKLYGVKTQADLDKLISQITVTNKKHKDWPIYNKFLSCSNVELDRLKENPEFIGLDDDFKKLLLKQREIVDVPEQEGSLFSK